MTSLIADLLHQHPCLRPFLDKAGRRYRRVGELSGQMKLGEEPSPQEMAALEAFFGRKSLSRSTKGEVRLHWERFFAGRSRKEMDDWIQALCQCLGLPGLEARRQQGQAARQAALLGERLRLAYPELPAIHHHLQQSTALLAGQLERQGEAAGRRYFQAAEIVRFLRQNQEPVTFSELGARFATDSKALRDTELSRQVAVWLRLLEDGPAKDASPDDEADRLWQRHHVVRDRLAVQATVFGPLLYRKHHQTHDWILRLWQQGEPATLSWANLRGMEALWPAPGHEDEALITIENEAPFTRLVREGQPGTLLYTCGFPNDAVLTLYRLLPQVQRHHWGDSDLAGLRIAAILHAVRPLRLWRCDLATLAAHGRQLLAVGETQARQIEDFLNRHPDFPFQTELRHTLTHGWLEQEGWQGEGRGAMEVDKSTNW